MARPKIIYLIKENANDKKKSYWNRVGVAWENSDGSLNLEIDFLPGVKMNVRDPKPRDDEDP